MLGLLYMYRFWCFLEFALPLLSKEGVNSSFGYLLPPLPSYPQDILQIHFSISPLPSSSSITFVFDTASPKFNCSAVSVFVPPISHLSLFYILFVTHCVLPHFSHTLYKVLFLWMFLLLVTFCTPGCPIFLPDSPVPETSTCVWSILWW